MKPNQMKLRVKTASKSGPTDEPNIPSKQTEFKITMTNIFRKIEDSVDHLNSDIYKGNQMEVPEVIPQKHEKSADTNKRLDTAPLYQNV